MKSTLSRHLQSALVTFISMFFILIGTEIAVQDPLQYTKTVIWALIIAAIRGAFKVAYESFLGSNDPMPTPLNSTTIA